MPPKPLEPPESYGVAAAVGWIELGLVKEALRELEALGPHREHPDAQEVWWTLLAASRRWEEALRCAQSVVQSDPDRAGGWINVAYSLHELGRTQEAYDALAQVVEKFRGREHFVIPYNLACYQCRLGHPEEAWRWLRKAVERCDSRTVKAMAADDPDLAPLREQLRDL
jgi:tetratricopeptide (TPR) repeat protein